MRRIDAHQHFWRLSRGDYGWLTPRHAPIFRDFEPQELAPLLMRNAIDATVLIQAAPTVSETLYMLSLADRNAFVAAVVGWTDFAAQDAAAQIARLAVHPKLRGMRPMIQDISDVDWMLRPELAPAFEALEERDLVFDALVLPHHLPNLATLLTRHPGLRVVVDHCAKPPIGSGEFAEWASDIATIARDGRAYCKLSGLVTEAGSGWSVAQLRRYVDHVLAEFGPQRMVWGSDWPVCLLAASYDAWIAASEELLGSCSAEDRQAIFGGNAARLYRL